MQFRLHIARNPVEVIFRSKKYDGASTEISLMRKAQIAGYTDEVADVNLNIALEIGASDPIPLKEQIQIGEFKYLVFSTTKDIGLNCYTLTLKKYNL